ncbi:hypothetical protein AVEN_12800-1 [Araneus ventricosus]|uniref:Uncharacterized protein n=1 Tax=Araneus ventricosus TaxID=182803 RepID=A0A4Y2AC42_ARAVE|nr:hypothetical protein AVEN_12800-1 [Araneus ventricosus]
MLISSNTLKEFLFLNKSQSFGAIGFQVRDPISMKIRRVWGLLHVKSYVLAKRPPVGVVRKFGEGVPAQVSSSSSDLGSKLRGQSLNSPSVASKRDINITKQTDKPILL